MHVTVGLGVMVTFAVVDGIYGLPTQGNNLHGSLPESDCEFLALLTGVIDPACPSQTIAAATGVCRGSDFQCSNNSKLACIRSSWVCEGHNDCVGGDDEKDCPNVEDVGNPNTCQPGLKWSDTQKCIREWQREARELDKYWADITLGCITDIGANNQWPDISFIDCLNACTSQGNRDNGHPFVCRSVHYNPLIRECTITDVNRALVSRASFVTPCDTPNKERKDVIYAELSILGAGAGSGFGVYGRANSGFGDKYWADITLGCLIDYDNVHLPDISFRDCLNECTSQEHTHNGSPFVCRSVHYNPLNRECTIFNLNRASVSPERFVTPCDSPNKERKDVIYAELSSLAAGAGSGFGVYGRANSGFGGGDEKFKVEHDGSVGNPTTCNPTHKWSKTQTCLLDWKNSAHQLDKYWAHITLGCIIGHVKRHSEGGTFGDCLNNCLNQEYFYICRSVSYIPLQQYCVIYDVNIATISPAQYVTPCTNSVNSADAEGAEETIYAELSSFGITMSTASNQG